MNLCEPQLREMSRAELTDEMRAVQHRARRFDRGSLATVDNPHVDDFRAVMDEFDRRDAEDGQ